MISCKVWTVLVNWLRNATHFKKWLFGTMFVMFFLPIHWSFLSDVVDWTSTSYMWGHGQSQSWFCQSQISQLFYVLDERRAMITNRLSIDGSSPSPSRAPPISKKQKVSGLRRKQKRNPNSWFSSRALSRQSRKAKTIFSSNKNGHNLRRNPAS